MKNGWRTAAAAYRKAYGEWNDPRCGGAEYAFNAATDALKAALPDLADREAMLETVAAVHYASVLHSERLYALWKPRPRK